VNKISKLKIITVIGTRPEATKIAPLLAEFSKNIHINSLLCVTAQHRDMLDQVLNLFNLKPDFDLNIMKQNQSLSDITTVILKELEQILIEQKPDLVLVHGDTTTTFASCLSAFYQQIPVGHVEAGLRSFDDYEPFPEEMNRKLTSAMATIHFCPTKVSKQNLINEFIKPENIYITGNTGIDCLKATVKDNYKFNNPFLNDINFKNKRIITITAHRRENIGVPLKNICNAIKRIVSAYDDVEVIYAVHYNPKVREIVNPSLSNCNKVHLIDPLDMHDMHNLMNNSYIILTDSGGIQEESPYMNVPVLVLRNVTERPEGVTNGNLKIAGLKEDDIFNLTSQLLDDKILYNEMALAKNPYGDGYASARITSAILHHFNIETSKPLDYEI
jgi:UDP-N-acetylglucosamine 2-epimerase (non-hydrolysing)